MSLDLGGHGYYLGDAILTDLNQVPIQASWRVDRDTIVGYRVPSRVIWMHPYAIDEWLSTDIFDRIERVKITTVRHAIEMFGFAYAQLRLSGAEDRAYLESLEEEGVPHA